MNRLHRRVSRDPTKNYFRFMFVPKRERVENDEIARFSPRFVDRRRGRVVFNRIARIRTENSYGRRFPFRHAVAGSKRFATRGNRVFRS